MDFKKMTLDFIFFTKMVKMIKKKYQPFTHVFFLPHDIVDSNRIHASSIHFWREQSLQTVKNFGG